MAAKGEGSVLHNLVAHREGKVRIVHRGDAVRPRVVRFRARVEIVSLQVDGRLVVAAAGDPCGSFVPSRICKRGV